MTTDSSPHVPHGSNPSQESQLSLSAALAACAAGDKSGLRQLYDQEAPRMIGVALRIIRRRDLAEDIVHDAFMRIWRAAGRYDSSLGSPRAWIYAIVRNLAIDSIRNSQREEFVDDEQLAGMIDSASETTPFFERLSESNALRRCLQGLEPKRRASLLMAYAQGCSHGEIAGKLGVPLGTVKAWIRRSLTALRECMA